MLTCPECGKELPSLKCPECYKSSTADAKFCCHCGKPMPASKTAAKKAIGDPYDLENRVLCPDGACIGIINEHGVCTECGQPYHPEE